MENIDQKTYKSVKKLVSSWVFMGGCLPLFVGLVFIATGVGLLASGITGGAYAIVGAAVFNLVISAAFAAMGLFWFIYSIKTFVPYVKSRITLKKGSLQKATAYDYTQKIISTSRLRHHGRSYYSVKLRLVVDGKEVLCKTDYIFNKEQFDKIINKEVDVLYYKNFAVIVQDFTPKTINFKSLPSCLQKLGIWGNIFAIAGLVIMGMAMVLMIVFSIKNNNHLPKALSYVLIGGVAVLMVGVVLKTIYFIKLEGVTKHSNTYKRKKGLN